MENHIYYLGDILNHPTKMKAAFAEGSLPPESEWPHMKEFSFYVPDGGVTFTGDTEATVQVEINDPSDGSLIETKEWTLVKEADGWKFKSVSLPPAPE